jgi:hypothetical protein
VCMHRKAHKEVLRKPACVHVYACREAHCHFSWGEGGGGTFRLAIYISDQ